jgi:hypothetical protein
MRAKHIKKGYQKTPDVIVNMGLDTLYQEFVNYSIEREKTHEMITIKEQNPNYKKKTYKVDIWNRREDNFFVYAETMFGKKEKFDKKDIVRID